MAEGDYYRIRRDEQREGLPKKMPTALRKYIQAQRLLCDWLPHELTPEVVVKSPNDIYGLMSQIGFVWLKSQGYWRLAKNRKQPKSYFDWIGD